MNQLSDRLNRLSPSATLATVSYTHLRAHETDSYLVCRLLLEKKKNYIECHLLIQTQHSKTKDKQIYCIHRENTE